MLRFHQTLIIAAIAAAIPIPTSYAQAQRGRGERGGPGGPIGPVGTSGLILSLARYPVVQAELKLEAPQKTKIQALVEWSSQRQQKIRDQMNPPGQSGQGAAPGGESRRRTRRTGQRPHGGFREGRALRRDARGPDGTRSGH